MFVGPNAWDAEINTVLQLILDTYPEGHWISPTFCGAVLLSLPGLLWDNSAVNTVLHSLSGILLAYQPQPFLIRLLEAWRVMGTYGSLSHSPVSAALSGALRLILDSGTKHSQTLGCYSSWLHLWAYPKQFKMRSTIFLEYHCMKLTWNILRLLIEIHLFMNIKMIRDHSSVWRSFRIIHIKADLKFFFPQEL